MAFNEMTADSPFDGFLRDNLPQFFFEKFRGADLDRIEALISNFEIVFDNVYQKLKAFPDQLDSRVAESKYLYELAQLLGVQDIDNLSKYLDDDGNVTTITQEQYDDLLIQQRTYIANTIGRYLLKGTRESIKRLLYSQGLDAEIRELWAEDTINGPYFEYENSLVTKYGDAIIGSISGDIYSEEQPFDLLSDMSSDVPSASAIGDIEQYEQNNFGYQYLLDDLNTLYFKTSTDVSISGSEEDTWYKYDSSSLSVSGDIQEFKVLNDKIFIKTDINNLVILDYRLDDPELTADFSIDNQDCIFFDFIENSQYLFLDRDSKIEVRDIATYQKISASLAKPVGGDAAVNQIIKKKAQQYLIINDDKKAYILNISPNTYSFNVPATVYDLLVQSDEIPYEVFRIEDDEFTILKYNITSNILKGSYLFFDEDDNLTLTTSTISIGFTEVNDYFQYSERVLVLGDNKFGIYNLKDRTIDEYNYVTGGYDYKKVFFLDKFYVKRFSGSDLDFTKILGWNSFKEALYKSHYFDILVDIGAIEDLTIDIALDELSAFITDVIDNVKPVHTELQNVLTAIALIVDEEVNSDDSLSTEPVISGGSEYSLLINAKYDGQHPWKRTNDIPVKYNNVGLITDGITWTTQTSAADISWRSITYGNGLFVAVASTGTGNRVMTSSDGITWATQTSAADYTWNSITYGNGLFVAVSSSGTGTDVMTSSDGITWATQTTPSGSWQEVTYGIGLFVAVGISGNRVMTSPDGVTWTPQTASGNDWYGVTYGNGLFVAVASTGSGDRVMTSPNGVTWTIRASAANISWRSVIYGNSIFVAVSTTGTSSNRVMTSPDGITWTTRVSAAGLAWRSVTYGNGLFVAVASSGTGNRVMTSPDGIDWTIQTSAVDNDWYGVTYGRGVFAAVASTGTSDRVMTNSSDFNRVLKYGTSQFDFDVDTDDTDLDNLIYNSVPLP